MSLVVPPKGGFQFFSLDTNAPANNASGNPNGSRKDREENLPQAQRSEKDHTHGGEQDHT
ncbi:MAG TPA: hypothetical protein VFZ59_10965 [Verrucomicrobiae bacterium]|nr:hypothetical protein [Verrucomicrobiae bacterium]